MVASDFSFAVFISKTRLDCGILLELSTFHCAEKLKYWKSQYWKFSDKVIISKIASYANTKREVFAELLRILLLSTRIYAGSPDVVKMLGHQLLWIIQPLKTIVS